MATQELLSQLYKALEQSSSFQLLPFEKQSEIKRGFASATDEQLKLAMTEIQQSNLEAARNEQKRGAQEAEQIQAAQALKSNLVQEQKTELKENEAQDASRSGKEADKILASIDKKASSNPPKRKKFLGIF